MFSSKKFFILFLLSQIFLYGVTPYSHFHHSGGGLSSVIGSIFDHSDDDTPPPEENPGPSTTPPATPGSDDVPDVTPEEAADLIGNPIPPLADTEDPAWFTELNEIMESQTEPESDISVENYPTNILDGSFTEYEQEAAWSTENEAYEFENGEIVGSGYVPIDLEAANNDPIVQETLKFGSDFVIEKGIESRELASVEAQLQQLLAVSSRSTGSGTEYEFYVEIADIDALDSSRWPQAFFTVFVEAGSGRKGVTSYFLFRKDY